MPKPYYFITLTGHVSERASLTTLVNMLRSRSTGSLQLVDYDEELRRIVVRFSPTEIAFIKTLIGSYIDNATYEVKAKIRGRLDPSKARSAGGVVEKTPKTLLALVPCNKDSILYIEQKGRNMLVKYCMGLGTTPIKAVLTPSMVPPSLCSFNPFERDVVEVFEKARRCIEDRIPRLLASSSSE